MIKLDCLGSSMDEVRQQLSTVTITWLVIEGSQTYYTIILDFSLLPNRYIQYLH